jgi:hypothetical protein
VAERKITEGVLELERMYLVPAAELVEDVPRFQLHANPGLLTRDAFPQVRDLPPKRPVR